MYTPAMLLLRRPSKVILVVLFVCSIGMMLFAWNGAKGNPREGWSMVKVWTGVSELPGSGSRAYLITGPSPANTVRLNNGTNSLGSVCVRRDRRGLFFPWLQTDDVRLIQFNPQQSWTSSTDDPNFHDTLAAVRPAYVEYAHERGEWFQRVVDAIDAELDGAYPARTVSWGLFVLDAVGLIAPFFLVYSLTWLIVLLTGYRPRTGVDGPVLFERAE